MQGSRQGSPHLLLTVILVQFIVIALLLGGLSNEYFSNDYYRGWINSNYPWVAFLLQGQVDALLLGIAFGATVLLMITVRNDRRPQPAVESEHTELFRALDTRLKQDDREEVIADLENQDS